jgi:hypothetical protein
MLEGTNRAFRRALPIVFCLSIVAGCTGAKRRAASENDLSAPIRVVVENSDWLDMTIYAMPQAGGRFRIGTVGGSQSRTFVVRTAALGSNWFRLVADPIGSRALRTSDALPVSPGITAHWRIGVSSATSSSSYYYR